MTQFVRNMGSIHENCRTAKDLLRFINDCVPYRYRLSETSFKWDTGVPFNEKPLTFLFKTNGMAAVTGPLQSGKTTLLAGVAIFTIAAVMERDQSAQRTTIFTRYADEELRVSCGNNQVLFVDAAREFRSLRKLSAFEDEYSHIYSIPMLMLDDLDKVEPQYRLLIRDVIVHRHQSRLHTVVSMTDPSVLMEFDPQVRRRIEDGRQISLGPSSESKASTLK
jgi:hypothetical protein